MKKSSITNYFLFCCVLSFLNCSGDREENQSGKVSNGNFKIGWATADITPGEPVLIAGQLYARVSEGILDPITVTALAIESGKGSSTEKVIMISADLVSIGDNLRDNVRGLLKETLPEIKSEQVILHATHTHAAPRYSDVFEFDTSFSTKNIYGVELNVMGFREYMDFLTARISKAAEQAWNAREPGGISYGLGHAVVSHNRLGVDTNGLSTMMLSQCGENFSHVEGYEDHSVNLLYTWDTTSNLTGVVINVAGTSQATGSMYKISADYWHDTRVELRKRLGDDIFILPQSSAAGDQCPHVFFRFDFKAEERMQKIMFPGVETGRSSIGRRKQIAMRISDAVVSVLPYMKDNIEWDPLFGHKMEVVNLSRRTISVEDVKTAIQESEIQRKRYEQLLLEINENPGLKEKPRWYRDITSAYVLTKRGQSVKDRYELERTKPKLPVEIHAVRIGEIVIATNPFELYLDYGIRIKGRSPAIQTFLVQLAGSGTYVPSSRSISGGAYGAVPASTLIGSEGGQELVDATVELINKVFDNQRTLP